MDRSQLLAQEKGSPMGEPRGESDIEIAPVARRRVFTDAYKRQILEEVDRATHGEVGLILRREGLYSSTLVQWRRRRNNMSTQGKEKKQTITALQSKNKAQEKEIARLKLKLVKAEAMLDLQKKAADFFALQNEESERDS